MSYKEDCEKIMKILAKEKEEKIISKELMKIQYCRILNCYMTI